VQWRLAENCRNYRIVGEMATRLGGLTARIYSGFLRSGGSSSNYSISYYDTDDEQADLVSKSIAEFRRAGFERSEIVLLSFRTADASIGARLAAHDANVRPAWQSGNAVGYTSISAYKGLDNKVVLLTDVELTSVSSRSLFYTGLTRATESVRVLCNHRSQEVLAEWLTEGILDESGKSSADPVASG
jgi:hypothetical protein